MRSLRLLSAPPVPTAIRIDDPTSYRVFYVLFANPNFRVAGIWMERYLQSGRRKRILTGQEASVKQMFLRLPS
jgi:hypothetical protein